MNEFVQVQMSDVADVTSAKRIFARDYVDSGIPFYRGKEITELHRGSLHVSTDLYISKEKFSEIRQKHGVPEDGDILLTSVGTLGSVYLVKPHDKFYFKDGNVTWFRNLKGLTGAYLRYWLMSPEGRSQLQKCVIGSSQSAYTIENLKRMEIRLPSLQAQHRVATILKAYDDLIEVNQRRIMVLEELARGLFKDWFVCLRFPGHKICTAVDTPNGLLPEGWKRGVLGDIVNLEYGKALKADTRVSGSVGVYGSSGMVGNHNAALVRGPGIIVGRKGNVGSIIYSAGDFWPIDTVYYVVSDYPLPFLFHMLQRLPFQNTDAAVPGLNRSAALKIPIAVPPPDLARQFADFAQPLRSLCDNLQATIASLAASRDLLLPRLISGELSVATAERELEAAA